jgi:phenylalanine-4-hydroxylase
MISTAARLPSGGGRIRLVGLRALASRSEDAFPGDAEGTGLGEHEVWVTLYKRQKDLLPGRACDTYLRGLDALEDPSPNRIGFDLERLMRTPYRIDDFQQTYFVVPSLQALREATLQDFGPIYERLARASDIPIAQVLPTDRVFTRGSQAYARDRDIAREEAGAL